MKLIFLILLSTAVRAAETEYSYSLEPIIVKAKSSFDSLGDDVFLPQKKITFDSSRSSTQDAIDKTQTFPSRTYGYPSGALGSNLGGRSSEDSQVSTLGVPLTLPQGGGPDLSIFPSFLWSGATISTVPTVAGFSPQGVSGSLQLDLWTRTQIRELKRSVSLSRITGSYDRNLQNFSLATKKDTAAIVVGMNQGRQKGPAAALSLYAIRKPKSHLLFHLLGSDQDGDNPGSKSRPTPDGRKKFWRVIPVLESHQEFNTEEDPLIVESTLYADLQQLKIENTGLDTNDFAQQFGAENALHWNDYTFALTARYVNYRSSTFGTVNEWPLIAQVSHDFALSDSWKMKLAGGGNFVTSVGFAPTARASFKNTVDVESNWFLEANSLAKMPTLTARYYRDSFFVGNPDLKPERVSSLIAGYELKKEKLETTTTLKAEYRNQIQITNAAYTTTINAGSATLLSLAEEFKWKVTSQYSNSLGVLLTYSQLEGSKLPYPDLPYFSLNWGGTFTPFEQLSINRVFKYVGKSTTSGGGIHPHYLLIDLSADYRFTPGITATLGCENMMDKRAEVIMDFPLPGRIFYLNLTANL